MSSGRDDEEDDYTLATKWNEPARSLDDDDDEKNVLSKSSQCIATTAGLSLSRLRNRRGGGRGAIAINAGRRGF